MSETAKPAPLADRVREFYTLREAEREARALPDDSRAATNRSLSLAFQQREAAETLWPRGCSAEALRLAKGSIELCASTLASFAAGDEAKPSWLTHARAVADDARARTSDTKLPELEGEMNAGHEATFHALVGASHEIERAMGLGLAAPKEIAATRRARAASTVALAALAIAIVAWWRHTPFVLHANASSLLAATYSAANAVDDDTKTAWLLPDKQTGWIDVTFGEPRDVKAVRVVSGNPPTNDRAVKDARVEAYLGGTIVETSDVTFREPVGAAADWTEVSVHAKCDRVRINVKSVHKNGGGIAEIEVR